MKAAQLYRYMQAPDQLNQETLPFLKELTERHPAFETGWILYLKNLKNLNDSSFGQELINGAIHIQDRRKLYLLLNRDAKADEQTLPTKENDEIIDLIFPAEYRIEAIAENDEPLQLPPNKSGKKLSLIEKFLEAQPKMPQLKDETSASPMDGKKQKEEDNDEFVTETLALIYAQQGYYKKAINIFEKLSLKYPEKSTYFAAHIEKIKSLMTN